MVIKITNEDEKENIARMILNDLPEWFGLPESTTDYIKNCKLMPFWTYIIENTPAGFIALKETSRDTAEVFVMGVAKDKQKMGIGSILYSVFEDYAKEAGYSFIQVKTVKMGKYAEYDITNNFYIKMGFKEFECIPTLWDKWNPCQIYVKSVK